MTADEFEYWYKAKVTGVWDGDSITVELSLGVFTYRHEEKIRLKGINTPELKGDTREAGLKARDVVRDMILGKEVILNTFLDKGDKYGRLLAIVYVDGLNLNQWLIDKGCAVGYEG